MTKDSKTIFFNDSKREICKKCGFPSGFCKHTIDEKYKELCSITPLSQESVWQLVRSYAICATEKRNLQTNTLQELQQLYTENAQLKQINIELKMFKKHIEEIVVNALKSKEVRD